MQFSDGAGFLECKSEGWWEDASEEWVTSDTIQPRQTIVIPLDGDEPEWLSRMSQKTRYNVRLAQKKDVQVIAGDDISSFHQLMQVTGQRDEFGVHSLPITRMLIAIFPLRVIVFIGCPLADGLQH